MLDPKKTFIVLLAILALVVTAIASYNIGENVGFIKGWGDAREYQDEIIIKQDSLLRKQTELCHRLMDEKYETCDVSQGTGNKEGGM